MEKARAALEKAYHDKGFQTVSVSVPQQNALTGRVILKVSELKVGQVRVKNSRYFDLANIKNRATSLKQGAVPNFNDVTRDIVSLNQWPDRRVTPALRAGVTPGTVDVDLAVEDKAPIHGSLEVNNRRSPNTSATRMIGTVRYDNLLAARSLVQLHLSGCAGKQERCRGVFGLVSRACRGYRLADIAGLRREVEQRRCDRGRHECDRPRPDRRWPCRHDAACTRQLLPHALGRYRLQAL